MLGFFILGRVGNHFNAKDGDEVRANECHSNFQITPHNFVCTKAVYTTKWFSLLFPPFHLNHWLLSDTNDDLGSRQNQHKANHNNVYQGISQLREPAHAALQKKVKYDSFFNYNPIHHITWQYYKKEKHVVISYNNIYITWYNYT